MLAEIVAALSILIPELGIIENTNSLLGIAGVDRIKTGTVDEAGSCLLFSQNVVAGDITVTLVGVVIGGLNHETIDATIQSLLVQADAGFQKKTLVDEGQRFATYDTEWGDESAAAACWRCLPNSHRPSMTRERGGVCRIRVNSSESCTSFPAFTATLAVSRASAPYV